MMPVAQESANVPHFDDVCANSIDRAIATVADREMRRLTYGMTKQEIASRLEKAFVSLKSLRRSRLPDYNEWVALLYLLWYQPQQINLSLSIQSHAFGCEPVDSTELHIVDYGAGALATPLSCLLMKARSQANGEHAPPITVHCIDTSREMMALGRSLWVEFARMTMCVPGLRHAFAAFNSMNVVFYESTEQLLERINRLKSIQYWIIALHVVYEENQREIKGELEDIRSRIEPVKILFSSHSNQKSVSMVEGVLPGGKDNYSGIPPQNILGAAMPYQGVLTETSIFRRELHEQLKRHLADHAETSSLLPSKVSWARDDVKVWFSPRKDADDLDDLPW